jgi:hypothetical protein
MKSPIQLFFALAVLLATATVAAQVYKWVDKDGRVQYSDTPPPPGATKADPKKIGPATASPATAAVAPKTLQERSKDADKRRLDDAEKAKKDEEAQKLAKRKEERCNEANRFKLELESGRPMMRNNDQGERNFISDDDRNAEIARMKSIMAEACSK